MNQENAYGAIIDFDGKYQWVKLPCGVSGDGQANDASVLVHWLENQAPLVPLRAVIQVVVPEISGLPEEVVVFNFEAPRKDETPIVRFSNEWLDTKAEEVAKKHGVDRFDLIRKAMQLKSEHPDWPERSGGEYS